MDFGRIVLFVLIGDPCNLSYLELLASNPQATIAPCQLAQPVFGCSSSIQGSTEEWTQKAGVHRPSISTWRHWSPVRRSAHVIIPKNSGNNLALGRRTKLAPETSVPKLGCLVFYAKEGALLQLGSRSYAVTSRRPNGSPSLAERVRRGSEVGATLSSALELLCSYCIPATENSPNLNSAPRST